MEIGIVPTMARRPRADNRDDLAPVRRGWAAGVAEDATRAASAAFRRAGFADSTLVLRWHEIAGPEVARLARPLRFQDTPGGGLLTLVCEPGAALFLGHDARALAGRINAYLGHPAVARVKFVQRTLLVPQLGRPPDLSPRTAPGPNDAVHAYRGPEPLKTALKSLARWRQGR